MKKNLFIISLFLILFSFTKVDAKILDIDDVVESVKNSEDYKTIQSLQPEGSTYEIKLNDDKTELSIGHAVPDFVMTVGPDYLEYDNRSVTITEEEAEKELNRIIGLSLVLSAIHELSGYDMNISNEPDYSELSYEKHGLSLETEEYELTNVSGDFMRYAKISLDTDKVDEFYKEYGSNPQEDKEPVIKVQEVTSKKVTIVTDPIEDFNIESLHNFTEGYLFKANTKEGSFEIVQTIDINDDGSYKFIDTDVEPGKTYYYKIVAGYSYKYSNILEVTIPLEDIAGAKEEVVVAEVKNPKTGVEDYLLPGASILLIGSISYILLKRKSLFKRI